MIVRNIPLNGNRPNPNMKEVETDDGSILVFYSYSTPVAARVFTPGTGAVFYRTDQYYSVTTSKHLNKWLQRRGNPETQSISEAGLRALLNEKITIG